VKIFAQNKVLGHIVPGNLKFATQNNKRILKKAKIRRKKD